MASHNGKIRQFFRNEIPLSFNFQIAEILNLIAIQQSFIFGNDLFFCLLVCYDLSHVVQPNVRDPMIASKVQNCDQLSRNYSSSLNFLV